MPPSKRKTSESAAETASAVFLHEHVLALPADVPGGFEAAVTAAIQAGHRPVATPYVEHTDEDPHGNAVRVTWAVPVERVG